MNNFGTLFRISTFGESHGTAIGVVIDGCPALLPFDALFLGAELARRRPGQSHITTDRNEADVPQVLSGVFEGKTTGAPIAILIANKDHHSADYDALKDVYRPSHADYTYTAKFGIRDHRGGGRASARETANWVAAGAVAKMLLKTISVHIHAFVKQVGPIACTKNYNELDLTNTELQATRCPDNEVAKQMELYIEDLKQKGDTVGGMVQCVALNVPAGWGEPVFHKLHAQLGQAMLSINAAKGFEMGDGFEGCMKLGSEQNDVFSQTNGEVTTLTNHSGGVQGGISNGQPIWFNVGFKPVSTLNMEQQTINQASEPIAFKAEGRHDPCVLPRAVPIVEALTALVLVDAWLMQQRNIGAKA
jgi:chorismate synthase